MDVIDKNRCRGTIMKEILEECSAFFPLIELPKSNVVLFSYDRDFGVLRVDLSKHQYINSLLYLLKKWDDIFEELKGELVSDDWILFCANTKQEVYSDKWLECEGTAFISGVPCYGGPYVRVGYKGNLNRQEMTILKRLGKFSYLFE